MKIVVLNSRERFRKEDLKRLAKYKAVFYEKPNQLLSDIKELQEKEEVVIGLQGDYLIDAWENFPWEEFKKYTNIKGLCLSTTAYDYVPFKEMKRVGIMVTNVPGKSTDSVAEYYVFLMIGLLRKLPLIVKNDWQFKEIAQYRGTDAKGLTAGIVGLGKIGAKVADLCKGMEMNVIYWNRSKKNSPYQSVSLEELFKNSDVVFLTTTANESTKGLIPNSLIDSMKKTAIVVTPITATPYDKDYILQKVANSELGGFGFETNKKMSEFTGNVFASPEIAYFTQQTLDNESRILTDSLISIIEGKPVNVINA